MIRTGALSYKYCVRSEITLFHTLKTGIFLGLWGEKEILLFSGDIVRPQSEERLVE